jgi:diguanylate cyclase (GGDEF)-like protein
MKGKQRAAEPQVAATMAIVPIEGGSFASFARFLLRIIAAVIAWLTKPRHLKLRVVELEQKVESLTGRMRAITEDTQAFREEGLEILEQMGNAYLATDRSGAITLMNGAASAIFQTELSDIAGINLFDFLSERCRTSSRDLPKVFTGGVRVRGLRVEFVGLKGQITPCLLTIDQAEYGPDEQRGSAFVATVIDNSEVEMLTFVDPLTGLYNRRYFDKKLAEDYAALERGKMHKLSLVFLDVDWFKNFNEQYGHQIGDRVLQQVGNALKRTVRMNDTAARFGGEEFVAILAATDEQGALTLADRIRRSIGNMSLDIPGHGTVRITASVGTSTHRYESPSTVERLVAEANEAMRLAKTHGRNQTKDYAAVRASHPDLNRDK